ncbi:CEL4b mannanase [Auriculariales sp. MPI-PUGE-AT-0066]|nr:CEL4b mannanase [Auriculariales sp. MPI-PUGE-AT-0066]
MKAFAALLALTVVVSGQQTAYGQCGGIGINSCVSGYYCAYQNDWYSQCIPGTATSTSTSTSTSSSSTSSTSTSTTTTPATTGYLVATKSYRAFTGQKFTLNGSTYFVVGTNAYWLAQMSNDDIDKAFSDLQAAGMTVVRTWGFNDVTSAPSSGTYYQLWSGGVGTLNTGSNGLGKFDYVVSSAKAHGIRLIVALTNNWSVRMDVYVSQLNSGGTHDTFYTNSNIITAFQKYVKGFVSRYVSEPTIMGWELANEPRCGGSSGSPSSACNSTMLYTWAKTMSAYIKSIDSNHLVAIGDEGWINSANPPSYPYQGNTIGIDFEANLAITTTDFGTLHLYPESWGQSANITGFGTQWITDHATIQKKLNKPVIIEEYGVTSNKPAVYQSWFDTIVSSGLTGELYWQQGTVFPDGTKSWDDGYAVFPTDAAYPTITAVVKAIKARG